MSDLEPSPKILFSIALALIFLIYHNTISWLVGSWIYNPYYSHGFIVLAASIYLTYRVVKKSRFEARIDFRGLYVLFFSLVVHVFATLWDVDFLSAISLLMAVYGLIMTFYGSTAKRLSFPVFFMLLAIPFPIYGLTNQLEVLSAQASTGLVSMFGIKASNAGAEIYLKSGSFVVGAPCSGIRSIISLLTVATFYVYLINEKLWVKALLIVLSLPLALLANVFRISSILIVAEFFGRNVALGVFHYVSDIIFFITAVVMLMLLRRGLECLT